MIWICTSQWLTATIAKSDDSGVLGHGQVLGNVAQHLLRERL